MLKAQPYIQRLGVYPLAKPVEDKTLEVINLANNELWQGPSDAVIESARNATAGVNIYPDSSAYNLRHAIANRYQINADNIVCSNGSCELISMLCQIYCSQGDEVVVGPYSYLYFRTAAQISGAEIVCPDGENLHLDLDALLKCVNQKTKIVFIDNPQNPIGEVIPASEIRRFHAALPSNVLLVLDSAYAEFVEDSEYEAGVEMVESFANCIMLRTFSKVYGLAAMRIGWCYGPSEIIDLLNRVRQPSNLSSVSMAAATTAIQEDDLVAQRLNDNKQWRESLSSLLRDKFHFKTVNSHTNFVLAKVPQNTRLDGNSLYELLRAKGVLVRPMSGYGLPQYIRVTVGTQHAMNRLEAEMINILK